MIQVPRFKNNGDITKFLIKITIGGASEEEIEDAATRAMMKFPLSSHKLLYDDDHNKVSTRLWTVLLGAAVKTDNIKARQGVSYLVNIGVAKKEAIKMTLPFGRSTIKAKDIE